MSDLINRADAIEAVENNSYGMGSRASVKAIKALPSAELPKGDLISRADAIDAVAKAKATDPFGRYDKQNIGIDWALDALEALPSAEAVDVNDVTIHYKPYPSAEAVQGWIPCSERLPQKREEVIYSLDSDIVSTGFMDDRDYNGGKVELHWKDLESGVIIEPQAWMPLPKPYREDGEE